MKKAVTLGGAMQDIFIELQHCQMVHVHTTDVDHQFIAIEEGRKIEVSSLEYHVGGGAVNSAASFVRFGFDTQIICKIGRDEPGDFICDRLVSQGIGVDYIVRAACQAGGRKRVELSHQVADSAQAAGVLQGALDQSQPATGTSFILPCQSGNRAIFVHRGANLLLREQEIFLPVLATADLVYITSLSGSVSALLPNIAAHAKKSGALVATNPGTSQLTVNVKTLLESLVHIDILMLNAYEATLLMRAIVQESTLQYQSESGSAHNNIDFMPDLLKNSMSGSSICFTLRQFFRQMVARGPRTVVVTNGAEGVYVFDGVQIYFHPSIATKVVSTVGAGDAFNATFVACLLKSHDIIYAIRAGIVQVASVLANFDSQTGLLAAQELARQVDLLDKNLLQVFNI